MLSASIARWSCVSSAYCWYCNCTPCSAVMSPTGLLFSLIQFVYINFVFVQDIFKMTLFEYEEDPSTHKKVSHICYCYLYWFLHLWQQKAAKALCLAIFQRAVRRRLSICCLSVHFAWHSISWLSGWISIKLATNIHHVSGHCWKGIEGQRSWSKVKIIIMTRPFWPIIAEAYIFQRCDVELFLLLFILDSETDSIMTLPVYKW